MVCVSFVKADELKASGAVTADAAVSLIMMSILNVLAFIIQIYIYLKTLIHLCCCFHGRGFVKDGDLYGSAGIPIISSCTPPRRHEARFC